MADGTLKVGTITTSSGSGTITLGQSGETVDMANGTITLNSSMKNTPAFFVSKTSSVNGSSGSATKATFNLVDFDTDSAYDSTTNYRFTVPSGKAGKYFFNIQFKRNNFNAQRWQAWLRKNGNNIAGSELCGSGMSGTNFQTVCVSAIDDASVGDYYEAWFYQDSGSDGGPYNDSSTSHNSFFQGYRIIGA
tara:strand:- start:592 stop:1164 length:573 start_codon:yes stop_codon:yes gene_type:complete